MANPIRFADFTLMESFTIVVSSNLAIDAFFGLSAFLSTIKIAPLVHSKEVQEEGTDRQIKKEKSFGVKSVAQLWLYRFLRLAPLYYFVFLFSFMVIPFLGDGPMWFTYEREFISCETNWWSVFTMTINFFPALQLPLEGCFFWGWVIAAELQIFLVLPLFVWLLLSVGGKLQIAILATCFVLACGLNAYLVWAYGLTAGLLSPANFSVYMAYVNKPYTKLHAVVVGVGFGLLFDQHFSKPQEVTEKSWAKWLGVTLLWFACFGGLFYLATGNFEANQAFVNWT